ncbi:MAG: iron-sulfur cluster carrier protein ApbC [Neisseriales bacterium]|nr:MAG: iron-sulfur cluster carrier protein ApbC [Neisseriales bacterium]
MKPLTENAVLCAVKTLIDPLTGKPYIEPNAVQIVALNEQNLVLKVVLGYPALSQISSIYQIFETALVLFAGGRKITIQIKSQIMAHQAQRGLSLLPAIKNTIIVASGKGGVGKSTVAVNLALALHLEGAKVGLLDADIYGPSLPLMLGLSGKNLPVSEGPLMQPLMAHGIEIVSIGLLVKSDQAMIWRGPMIAQALQQLLHSTAWGNLDYLVIDTPPGTGDILLTLAQKVPITGAIIVTTPQEIALNITARGMTMLNKMNIPLLGFVENMAQHTCSQCGHVEHIFGQYHDQGLAQDAHFDKLGSLPLEAAIQAASDQGCPMVVANPDSPSANIYRDMALRVAAKIAQMPRDFSSKLPKVTVRY